VGDDLWLDWASHSSEESGRVIRSIELEMQAASSGNAVTTVVFDPPVMRVVIGYSVVNGNIVAGAPTGNASSIGRSQAITAAAPVIPASQAASQLSLFWYNGNEWVKGTGSVNAVDATVSFTGGRAGKFQIRAATHASGTVLTRVYPRIITPNGDGWNDKVIFQFDNSDLLPLSGKVFDITGASVASLAAGPNPDSTLTWDGKDSGGRTVPAGIYLYQISVGGTNETGTVVVAR
jgi:hypothetical protein